MKHKESDAILKHNNEALQDQLKQAKIQNTKLIDQLDALHNERILLKTNVEQLENLVDQLDISKKEKNKLMDELQEVKKANYEKNVARNENEKELDLI